MTVPRRVALWGTFDVDNYGDHLFPLVARHELARRLPRVVVDCFAPVGSRANPTPFDLPGSVVEPLSRSVPETYDLVVVGGGEILHENDALFSSVYGAAVTVEPSRWFLGTEPGANCEDFGPKSGPKSSQFATTVAWNAVGVPFDLSRPVAQPAYAAVRDPASLERVRAAGVRDAVVVPDTALLLDRVFEESALDARLASLRRAHCFPASSEAVVVQGCDLLAPFAGELAAALSPWLDARPSVSVVLLETGRCRGDVSFSDAFAASLRRHVHRMPRSADLLDIAAVIRGAAAFAGSSLHGAITALVYGRPFAVANLHGESKLQGFGSAAGVERRVVARAADLPAVLRDPPLPTASVRSLQRRVDDHFDRMAALVEAAAARRRRARLGRTLRRLRPAS